MGLGSWRRTRKLWLLAAALLTALVISVTGLRGLLWWPVETSSIDVQLTDVASIQILPLGFGPTLMWNHPTTSPPSEQQSVIEAAIPIPLPGPEVQPLRPVQAPGIDPGALGPTSHHERLRRQVRSGVVEELRVGEWAHFRLMPHRAESFQAPCPEPGRP
jgi:hypothetical protein